MYIHVYPIILYYIQERNLRRPRKQEARSKKQETNQKKSKGGNQICNLNNM